MQKELLQIQKLLDRKREYMAKLTDEKAISRITIEMNIIENFITAAQDSFFDQQLEIHQYSTLAQQKIEKLQNDTYILQGVCLLHGIDDLDLWQKRGPDYITSELRRDKDESVLRIPNQLRIHFYGENE